MAQRRVSPLITLALLALSVLGMVVVSWYQVGDQTDWSTFSAPQCREGTCGPDDFNLSKLDYVIEPIHVSAHTDLVLQRVAPFVLIIPIVALLLLVALGRTRLHVLGQLAVVLATAAFAGATLRSATMASVGAVFFGGLDVVALAVAVVVAGAICWGIQRSAGSDAESVD